MCQDFYIGDKTIPGYSTKFGFAVGNKPLWKKLIFKKVGRLYTVNLWYKPLYFF